MHDEIKSVALSLFKNYLKAENADVQLNEQCALADLGMESLELLELVFTLETHFSICVDAELLADMETVGDIIAMIEKAVEAEAA